MDKPKSEITAAKILDCALDLFRNEGFDRTTMRDIAASAGVATGAAYYYYSSKEAIVMAFYRRASDEMLPLIESAMSRTGKFQARLHELIRVKLNYFSPNRSVLRTLLRNGADPKHPLSPFSAETRPVRDADIAWFRDCLDGSDIHPPRDLAPHLPEVLWLFQMGIILFWVIDDSPGQERTTRLLDLSCRMVTNLLRLSALPLTRPIRKAALQLIEVVKGEPS